MKKIIFALVILAAFLAACSKSDNKCDFQDSALVAPANEIDSVQSYLTANGINATQHPAGFFYTITTQGTGQAVVNLCSNVTVKYRGTLTSGKVFDSTATGYVATFQLGRVIPGWQKGIPLISKGGKIMLYIPPTLGYGNQDTKDQNGVVVIPANSILVFEVEVTDIT